MPVIILNLFFVYIIENFVKIKFQNHQQKKNQVCDVAVTKNACMVKTTTFTEIAVKFNRMYF